MNNLAIIKSKPSDEVIDCAKELLNKSESGETVGLLYVMFRNDGTYCCGGTALKNTSEKIGALFQLMHDLSSMSRS